MAKFIVNGEEIDSPHTPSVESYRQWNGDWESEVEIIKEQVDKPAGRGRKASEEAS